jgi:predicted DNA-binding transcriptional regulator YafY
VVFDQFGTDIPVIKTDNEHFKCTVNVTVSSQFLSWILAFGNRAKILSPENVSKKLIQHIEDIKSAYN